MLKPAQLYAEELERKIVECWYDPRYIYVSGYAGIALPELDKSNAKTHFFVSIDNNDNVIGYIAYSIDWEVKSAYGFEAMSFDFGNLIFINDIVKAIRNIFRVYNLNRLTFSVMLPNPAATHYATLVPKMGGEISGYSHQAALLMDGKLHDIVDYEIMAENFKKTRFCIEARWCK